MHTLQAQLRQTPDEDVRPLDISLSAFKPIIYRRYLTAPHLDLLDEKLEAVTRYIESGGETGIGRLIIEMPPRHGKTLTTSRLYPVWHLGRNPSHRIMLVSYGQDLSDKNSRWCRNVIRAPAYTSVYPGLQLADDSASVKSWDLAHTEGGADSLGIGGGATGKGAHLLIIDDPIKNREQAESPTIRNKIWDGYTDDLYTRLEPGGAVIVMATRWHQDDLTGRLLKREGDSWTRLRLPALAEDNDPLGRAVDEALWPARYPADTLKDIRDKRTGYTWSSLYQQSPTPAEGGIFKRAWFADTITSYTPEITETVRFWDLAMSERESADYTASVKIGRTADDNYVILNVAHRRLEWDEVVPWMVEIIRRDGPRVRQGVEQAAYMTRAVKELNRVPALHDYNIRGYKADKDKLTRALPFAAKCAAGVIALRADIWTDIYIEELCAFPNGAHDDLVDASSGAWRMLSERRRIEATYTSTLK